MSGKRVIFAAVAVGTAVGVGMTVTGCSAAPVDDRPVVRIAEAARPSPAIPLGGFLPTAQELAAELGTGAAGLLGHPVEGGADMLLDSVDETQAAPADCVSAAYRLQDVVYDGSPVQSVATNTWAGGGFDGPPVTGYFGIVQMSSAGAAQDFFATLADDWYRCNGQTLTRQHPEELSRITDVALDGAIVSASILHAAHGVAASDGLRAVAVAADCIVEVELTDPRATGDRGGAADVADLIVEKIAARR
ncbi:sensor domain-containing protein [Mycobacterium sp. pV006]|uniref:sensor domain-containing protein n=1 Tax=Mycobacterium sp. pV006 TaxID=3238983 RepID=UPI00351B2CD0